MSSIRRQLLFWLLAIVVAGVGLAGWLIYRQALAEAMCEIIARGDHWRGRRDSLQAESVIRFSAEQSVERHAEVLRLAAASRPLSAVCV